MNKKKTAPDISDAPKYSNAKGVFSLVDGKLISKTGEVVSLNDVSSDDDPLQFVKEA
jgi:hypothetical protein